MSDVDTTNLASGAKPVVDLTRYRIDTDAPTPTRGLVVKRADELLQLPVGVLVPDDTLQQIADAWETYLDTEKGWPSVLGTDEGLHLIRLLDALGDNE